MQKSTETHICICKDPMVYILISFISFLGFLSLSKHVLRLTSWTFIHFLRPTKSLAQSYGPWAVVTGSTDGIGKALATELAHNGLNLVLVSRDPAKLARVAREIEARVPGRSVKAVAVDFSDEEGAALEKRLEEAMEGLEVGVVVNNVGVTYPRAMYFHEVEEEVWRRVVKVNVGGTTRVTRAAVKGMVGRRRGGAIVNIASGAGIVVPSHPLFAVYAATKAYIDEFSRNLYVEYKSYGIHVQSQVPLYVATKMVSRVTGNSEETLPKPSLFTPTPEAYAKAAVARIGYEPRCTPYWAHSLQWALSDFLPDALLDAWRLSVGVHRRARALEAAPIDCLKLTNQDWTKN